jgi:hypothetical protein
MSCSPHEYLSLESRDQYIGRDDKISTKKIHFAVYILDGIISWMHLVLFLATLTHEIVKKWAMTLEILRMPLCPIVREMHVLDRLDLSIMSARG